MVHLSLHFAVTCFDLGSRSDLCVACGAAGGAGGADAGAILCWVLALDLPWPARSVCCPTGQKKGAAADLKFQAAETAWLQNRCVG